MFDATHTAEWTSKAAALKWDCLGLLDWYTFDFSRIWGWKRDRPRWTFMKNWRPSCPLAKFFLSVFSWMLSFSQAFPKWRCCWCLKILACSGAIFLLTKKEASTGTPVENLIFLFNLFSHLSFCNNCFSIMLLQTIFSQSIIFCRGGVQEMFYC